MCQSPFHPFLHALPKCEHHLHIEGALTPTLLFALAAKNNVTLPSEEDAAFSSPAQLEQRYKHFTSLDDFLSYYYIGMSVLVTESDFEALAWDYFTHASADGVAHAEIFFDPQAHLCRGVAYDTVLSGISAARTRARAELAITSELICCFLRHLPVPETRTTFERADLQASLLRGDVIGIGLDSSEKDFPPELFKDLYERAASLQLKLTAHAGEEGPATYIRTALDDLHVGRIDHGIRLAEDSALLQRVAREKILLSVCPISNVFLRCVSSISELPIRQFLDAGVPFSINSDDPAYFGGNYILQNFCAVQEAFDLSVADWTTICEASIRGSWCSSERRDEMSRALETVAQEFDAMRQT